VPFGHEPSARFARCDIDEDRFLLSLHKRSLGADAKGIVSRLCGALQAPPAFAEQACDRLQHADLVHFGHEGGSGTDPMCKLYLEYAAAFRQHLSRPSSDNESVLIFEAYKWRRANNRVQAVTRYRCRPRLGLRALRERIAVALPGERHAAPRHRVGAFLDAVCTRMAARDVLLMDVEETANPRRSIDINAYDANLKVADLAEAIVALADSLGVAQVRARAFVARVGPRRLGHLSAGIDRAGEAFATVYFGVEPGRAGEAETGAKRPPP
ncbi:MAG: hypothetical protein ACR2RL_20520, partial [Gammaproteobacteria bacterium]